jgi:hypothetical protein
MLRIGRYCAALIVGLIAGCGGDEKPPLAPVNGTPPGNVSPEFEAVFPAARSTGVFYDTEIWVRFTEPLDPATVNDHTVFLKLDTARIPATFAYDVATRTLSVVPQRQLALLRTYTVDVTSGVRTAGGRPLSPSFWQFKTNGLRRLVDPTPAEGASGESPFTLLRWGETDPSAGNILYRLYAGTDSAAVAARGGSPIYSGSEPLLVPSRPFGLGTRTYWAVTAINQTSHEQLDGPVWSFETLPPGLPVDSLSVDATEWGHYDLNTQLKLCQGEFLFLGTRYRTGIHWPLRETAANLRLAGARIRMYSAGTNPLSGAPSIYPVRTPWATCGYSMTVPVVENTKLADAVRIGFSLYALFESDALTAHIEAGARHGLVYGFGFRASTSVLFLSPYYRADGPILTLYYYRTPPVPSAAQGP